MTARVILQLDVGNSSAKWRLLVGEEVVQRGRFVPRDESSWAALSTINPSPSDIWISSVASEDTQREFDERLYACWGVKPWFARTAIEAGGLRNSYDDPARMGVDRWLAMLGARARTQSRLCVVDVGSALTIDFVSGAGQHEGGYIIPGPGLMERALLLDTDRVRFDEEIDYALTPGTSTAQAVRHGIAMAQVGSVSHALRVLPGEEPQLFFCGGGGNTVATMLGQQACVYPDLLFEGLALAAALRVS